jgi:uncharacterized glyoxalase superfamily protein PhnB
MLRAVTKVSILTTNQNEALAFYTEKLGFVIRADVTKGDFRWLTVSLPSQPELELVLLEVKPDSRLSQDDVDVISRLLDEGKIDPRPVIETDDIEAVYADLTAKGVEFVSPPTKRGWGTIDALFRDNSGNSWLVLQSVPVPQA